MTSFMVPYKGDDSDLGCSLYSRGNGICVVAAGKNVDLRELEENNHPG